MKPKRKPRARSWQPKPRRGRKPFITRAEARRRAAQHVMTRVFKGARVEDGKHVRFGAYLRADYTLNQVWVVYKNSEQLALKSSDVVLICKRTGRVLYEGPAGDEG